MVLDCPRCARPCYVSEDRPGPTACRDCGTALSDTPPPRVTRAARQPGPADVAAEVGRINDAVEAEAARGHDVKVRNVTLAVGGGLLLIAALMTAEILTFQQSAQRVSGTVAHVEVWTSTRGRVKNLYKIEYATAKGTESLRSGLSGEDHSRGDAVPLLVSKSDPSDARPVARLWSNTTAAAGFGGLVFAAGLALHFCTARQQPVPLAVAEPVGV